MTDPAAKRREELLERARVILQVQELHEDNSKLRALLARTYDASEYCHICGKSNPVPDGHRSGCELAAAIASQAEKPDVSPEYQARFISYGSLGAKKPGATPVSWAMLKRFDTLARRCLRLGYFKALSDAVEVCEELAKPGMYDEGASECVRDLQSWAKHKLKGASHD